jgi:hypothetical protein
MRILVLGGTGGIGVLLIRELLANGHILVVYARSPEKLPEDLAKDNAVVIIKGQLRDEDQLLKAVEGVDAVVSALGPVTTKGPFHPSGTPLAKAYSLIIDVMHKQNVKRLVLLGTASIKDPHDKFSVRYASSLHFTVKSSHVSQYTFSVLITLIATLARTAYKDIVAIGETVKREGKDLHWTIVRVPILTNEASKEVVAGYVGDGKTKPWLARAAFASFAAKELEKNEWTGKAPLISSP